MQKNINHNYYFSLILPTSFSVLKVKPKFLLIPGEYSTIDLHHPASNYYFLKSLWGLERWLCDEVHWSSITPSHLHSRLQLSVISVPRGSVALVWSPQTPGTHTTHRHRWKHIHSELLLIMCVCVLLCAREKRCMKWPEGVVFPGTVAIGSCKPSGSGVGNQTWARCESFKWS